jgi:Cu+-exporting ATPase
LRIAAGAERGSEHPLGQAIAAEAERRGLAPYPAHEFRAVVGGGIQALVRTEDSRELPVLLGNRRFLEESGVSLDGASARLDELEAEGKTPMILAMDGRARGILAVSDRLKEGAAEAVDELHRMGMKVVLLTGDHTRAALAIARQAGISPDLGDRVVAEVLPQDKAELIRRIQREGQVTAMVGDGINDAPALAQADLGIAMGGGTDVALEAADITLLGNDLKLIPRAILLSRKTVSVIRQNLFWAFIFNIVGIPVAAGLLYPFWGILLNPIVASAAMAMSSVTVVSNSLRLRGVKLAG